MRTHVLPVVFALACTAEPAGDGGPDGPVAGGDSDVADTEDPDTEVVGDPWIPPTDVSCPPATLRSALTPADATWTVFEVDAGAELGAALAVGDVDGDGHLDLVVGAPDDGQPYTHAGTVDLFRGPLGRAWMEVDGDGVRGRTLFPFDPDRVGGLGSALATVDLDGDGDAEVIATAPAGAFVGGSNGGLVAVLDAGSFDGDGVGAIVEGVAYGDGLGTDVVAWRDGHGQPRVAAIDQDPKAVRVFGPGLAPVARFESPDGWGVGRRLAVVGDVDGDGEPELAVGEVTLGTAVLSGAALAEGRAEPLVSIGLPAIPDYPYGDAVPWAMGDQDGDGLADLLVRTEMWFPNFTPYPSPPGPVVARVYTGWDDPGAEVDADVATSRYRGPPPVIATHDLDGDGVRDLITADAWGRIDAVQGPVVGPAEGLVSLRLVNLDGEEVTAAVVADLTGDRRPDIVLGQATASPSHDPRRGSGVVRLWELCPASSP